MSGCFCSACEFTNPAGFRFCGQCGKPLAEGGAAPTAAQAAGWPNTPVRPHVQRRQLTVLFCDLVGSTSLSQQLDPEDLRTVIRGYQQVVQPAIERHGGFVSRFLGDGVLAIFGYPQAHEDNAVRAVLAAQDVITAMAQIDWQEQLGQPLDLNVRIGIATGLVIAGDLIGKDAAAEEAVVGETPNLAARLQSLAEPGTVLISDLTRRLLGRKFRLRSLGERVLKGFRDPVPVWRVDATSRPVGYFSTSRVRKSVAMVNRHDELKLLRSLWSDSCRGNTSTVVISGDAGIGKSCVAQALRERIALDNHFFLRFQCSAYHVGTALFPITVQFERMAQIERSDSPARRRDKLRGLLRTSGIDTDAALPSMAALLNIPGGPHESFQQLSASDQRAAVLQSIKTQIGGLSRLRPVLVVVEDIHWSDPTTLELLALCGSSDQSMRLMMVLTERGEAGETGRGRGAEYFPHGISMRLNRLSPDYASELVRNVASDYPINPALVQSIVAKADGVALFVEELTRSLISSPTNSGSAGRPVTDTAARIPESLHDLLMARLDSLGHGRRVAQIAAVIGRQFSDDLLSRIVDLSADELQQGLRQLTSSGLVLIDSHTQDLVYSFKHALVRDTAYQSLLHRERRAYHARIAAELELFEGSVTPELLARHHTEAGQYEQAVGYWMKAGQAASQRSAHLEAVQQFEEALSLSKTQPQGVERDRLQLEILVNLGPMLSATTGSHSADTEKTFRQAVALTRRLPVSHDHFTALWGWWLLSKNFEMAAERAAQLQQLAEELGDDGLRLQAHHCQWAVHFHLGDHAASYAHVSAGLELYADRDYRSHAAHFGGHDPRVCGLGERAQILWLTGFPQQAVSQMKRARVWAEELKQSGSIVHVMDMNLLLLRYRQEPEAVAGQAQELETFATKHQFPEYLAKAKVFRGWALAKLGRLDQGIDLMREGIASHTTIGGREDPPVWREMLADGYADRGDHAAGLAVIAEAFSDSQASGLRFWLAELHRREGELLRRLDASHWLQAQRSFEQAIAVAASQQARSLELRALMSLLSLAEEAPELVLDINGHIRHLADLLDRLPGDDQSAELVAARVRLRRYRLHSS